MGEQLDESDRKAAEDFADGDQDDPDLGKAAEDLTDGGLPEVPAAGPEPVARPGRRARARRNMTPEQLAQQAASMEKSQAVADKNLIVIRSLAGKHPELQPQVGFTAKRLGGISNHGRGSSC